MNPPDKLRRTLRVSFLDGAFASVMSGLTEHFITPFALALKATNTQIGLLTSIPNIVAALFQLKSPDILEKIGKRRTLVTVTVFLHALMWLPIFSIPFLFREHPVPFLIFFYTLAIFFNTFGSSAWASMLSDLIPVGKRGSYFGWRNKYMGLIMVTTAVLTGLFLHFLRDSVLIGFAIIFILAFACRMASCLFIHLMEEPPLKIGKEHHFTFKEFLSRFPHSNFTRFVLYAALISLFTNIAGPFFSVYMLKELHFSYPTYIVVQITSAVSGILAMSYWGRHIDMIGSIRIIRLLANLLPILPCLWLVSGNVVYLLAVQIVGGYIWSGYNLSVVNFVYDTTTSEKRARCIAYYNSVNGMAVCFGALTGGFLATHLPSILGSSLLTLFLVSGILRAVANYALLAHIREVRSVEPVSRKDLLLRLTGLPPRRDNII